MRNSEINKTRSRYLWESIYIIALLFFLAFSLGPILWSFIVSITPMSEMQSVTSPLFPAAPTLENYRALLMGQIGTGAIFRNSMMNTFFVSILTVLFGIPLALFGAYPLARMEFKGREMIKNGILVTLVVPVFATIIPLFKMFSSIKLIDTFTGLTIVYISAVLPLTTWLIVSYFETLPKELEEAAQLDGCTIVQIIIRIFIPVSYPIILAATLISFLSTWNQFLIPLILAPSYATKPIAVVISEFVTKNTVKYGLMTAGGILAIFPPALIAVVFRQFLVQGLAGGSTKG